MQAKSLMVTKTYYLETDEDEYNLYRRDENSVQWEVLVGESWEIFYNNAEELEKLLQEQIEVNEEAMLKRCIL